MPKWTEEPWEATAGGDILVQHHVHDDAVVFISTDTTPADASRIVSCVNALRGMDPEAVGELRETTKNLCAATWKFFVLSRDEDAEVEARKLLRATEAALSKLENPK